MEQWSIYKFRILVFIIAVAGVTQGLLNPLLSTLLEVKGVPSSVNGLSASALYLGIIFVTPFCPMIVRKIGYKRSILIGLVVATIAILFIPFFSNIWIWALLRFVVGMGDSLLHYSTQLWITFAAPAAERGKRISLYGLMYGVGFGLGPQGIHLLKWGNAVPFLVVGIVMGIAIFLIYRLDLGGGLQSCQENETNISMMWIYRLGLIALCPAMMYGLLEAGMAVSFPIYGLREGISKEWVSILISAFVYGALLLQVPLGILSDRWDRKKVLILACIIGSVGMALIPLLGNQVYALLALFLLIGGFVGSLFTLGLSYLADLLPAHALPKANSMASIHFSLGSMLGPYMGGLLIQYFGGGSLFYLISTILGGFVILAVFYRSTTENRREETTSMM
ncbi:MFS transporter [Thermoflavimicrobium daqui]|uniref:MFS transporter n=1 Tax=Thermoflavimicrobium daqui TaxID=2137476 RepID=UPI00197D4EEA